MRKSVLLSTLALSAGLTIHAGAVISTLNPASNSLAANDDGSAPATSLGFLVNYFGTNTNTVFVNNNGNFTFSNALSTFTPFAMTGATGTPIIAGYFADVDTRGAGSAIVNYGATTFTTNDAVSRLAFVGNWPGVGYFNSQSDKLNIFQMVLIDRSDTGAGNFDIMLNYDQILWETGSASGGAGGFGGSSARVGFSGGTGAPGTFFEIAGSGVNGALLDGGANSLVANTNVLAGDPLYTQTNGRYVFSVRSGDVVPEVPEPGTWAIVGTGLGLIGFARVRASRKK